MRQVSDSKPCSALESRHHVVEWMITSDTEKVETRVFVKGWSALCEQLIANSDGGVISKEATHGNPASS